jgi:integrase
LSRLEWGILSVYRMGPLSRNELRPSGTTEASADFSGLSREARVGTCRLMAANGDRPTNSRAPRLEERVRNACRLRHYSIRTEEAYWMWVRPFILHNNKRHPDEMGAEEVTSFLNYLAVERDVAASTQAQALNALVFLYQQVLGRAPADFVRIVRAQRKRKVPVVLTQDEAKRLLSHLDSTALTMAQLLYGAGLRILECSTAAG